METFVALTSLSTDECKWISERVFNLSNYWIHRNETGPSGGCATLGCASYLDIGCSTSPQTDYYDRCQHTNQILMDNFADLYDRVKYTINRFVGINFEFENNTALPGFHIFWGSSLLKTPTPKMWHFDSQHRIIDWKGYLGNYPKLSFTLPLKLPAGGASIEIVPVKAQELNSKAGEYDLDQIAKKYQGVNTTYWYNCGKLGLQTDLWLHRIGRSGSQAPEDYRITLQGHLLNVDNRWIAYW